MNIPKPKARKRVGVTVAYLDRAFSKYIRARDSKAYDGAFFRCISCNEVKVFQQADCGHYLGRQYYATRWSDINCKSQCRYCNRFNEGLKHKFRESLVRMHGLEEIERLEAMHRTGRRPKPWECEIILGEIKAKMAAL